MKKIYITLIFCLLFVVGIIMISGLEQDSLTITSPADETWTIGLNYTPGFNISYDAVEMYNGSSNYSVICTLYIGDDNNAYWLINGASTSHDIRQINDGSTALFKMNHSLSDTHGIYYWTVKCMNETVFPNGDWRTTDVRKLYQDNHTPVYSIQDTGFTNNTWTTSTSLRFEVLLTDEGFIDQSLNVRLANSTGIMQTTTISNNTATNVTFTLTDGEYTLLQLNFSDPAGNTNLSSEYYGVKIDSVTPVITFISPADATTTLLDYQFINFTVVEQNNDTVFLEYDGANITLNAYCNGTVPNLTCGYNMTGRNASRNDAYRVIVNDSVGTRGLSSTQTVSYDSTAPTIGWKGNWTLDQSVVNWSFQINDTTPNTCLAKIYQWNSSYIGSVDGTLGTVGAITNCSGQLSQSDVGIEGLFRLEYNATDNTGQSVLSNITGIFKKLFSGWNLVTQPHTNSMVNIIAGVQYSTQVSSFNNQEQTFTTYAASTPSVNNATNVTQGDAVLIYTSADSYMFGIDSIPTGTGDTENITLYISGWNLVGLTKRLNLSDVYNMNSTTPATLNVSWASYLNEEEETFYTCSRSSTYCAGTTKNATGITLPKGYAAYALTDKTGNYTYNRTRMGT